MYLERKQVNFPDGYKEEYTDTWQECQKKCAKIESCQGFTWHNEDSGWAKSCALFSHFGWKENFGTGVSGPKQCPGKVKKSKSLVGF